MLRPALPIDSSALLQPVKRKTVILDTLSRLASPANKLTGAHSNARPSASAAGSPVPSIPVVSPKAEIADPFFDDLGEVAVGISTSANPTITGLAAYLTTLSNDQVFRQARAWKRFVRVRTDDLESVRVERAIRRVRSDIAAHLSFPSTVNVTMHNPSVLDDTRRTSREDSSNGNAPVLERQTRRFRENSLHDTDPALSLISDGKSNSEDNMLVPGDTASTAPSAMSDRSASASVSSISSAQSARTMLGQPSLKSKESAVSVAGGLGSSSAGSTNGKGRLSNDSVGVFDRYSFNGRHSEVEEEEEENVTAPSIRQSITTMSSASSFFSKMSRGSRTTLGQPSLKTASILSSTSAFVSTFSSRGSRTSTLDQPSLKSKESALSVGSPGSSSGASTNGEGRHESDEDLIEMVRTLRRWRIRNMRNG